MRVLKLDRNCEDAMQELLRVRTHQLTVSIISGLWQSLVHVSVHFSVCALMYANKMGSYSARKTDFKSCEISMRFHVILQIKLKAFHCQPVFTCTMRVCSHRLVVCGFKSCLSLERSFIFYLTPLPF